MKTIGNILWAILFGWWSALAYLIEGIVCCVTIIFIPVGIQFFKLAGFIIWPFGKRIVRDGGAVKTVINVLWAILGGWENALAALLVGVLCCCTIILIPAGLQMFKVAAFVIWPLGSTFE